MMKSHPLRLIIQLRLITSLLVALACASSSASSVGAADSPNAQTDVWFTVSDRNGQCVGGLRAEDVRVTEDGAEQQLTSFSARHDAPRAVVIVIDKSGSQEYLLPAVKKMARALADALVRPQKDRVAVVSFADRASLEQDFTEDRAAAQRSIDGIKFSPPSGYVTGIPVPGSMPGSTSMHDALWLVGGEVFASAPPDSRRVVVLLTDGVDTASQTKKRDSLARLLGANVIVYAVGMGDNKNFGGMDKTTLKDLAGRTGGRAYFPRKDAEVRATFAEIGQSLGCQNLLSYAPTNADAKKNFRKLKIEIVNPELRKQGLRVNHREGYVFGQAPATARGK
jgi:Ca-activated chloride channel family protein